MKRFITMFIALVAMFMGTKVMAQQAYALLSGDGKTLTFYCDGNKSTYELGIVYDLNEGNNTPEWIQNTSIETVAFDETFKNARPTTTCKWFYNLTSLSSFEGWENLNTSDVTNMNNMFFDCISLTSLDLRSFNTSNVVDMKYMFAFCDRLKSLDISSFNTSKVEDMQWMFNGCAALTSLDLRSFNTSNVQDMRYMFNSCANLTTITVSTGWNTNNVRLSAYMFSYCSRLVGGAGTTYNSGKVDKEYARIDGGESDPGYLTAPQPEAYAVYNRSSDNVSTLTFYYDNLRNTIQRIGIKKYDLNEGFYTPGWISDERFIEKVVFDESFKDARPTSTYCWFMGLKSLDTFVGWRNLNTSEVTNMNQMFMECSSLTSVDLSAFDTKKVQTMNSMFDGCTKLKTITVGANWNTANVTTSSYMFSGCTSIVGGAGTTYNINKVDKEYAIVDGLNGKSGYLTAVSYGITVSGKAVTFVNKYDVLGNETVNYDDDLNILTLIDADVSSINIASTAPNDLHVNVIGVCKVLHASTKGNAFTTSIAKTTIEGNGKLTIISEKGIGININRQRAAGLLVKDVDLQVAGYQAGIAGSTDLNNKFCSNLVFENTNCKVGSLQGETGSVAAINRLECIRCSMTTGEFVAHKVAANPMIIQRSGGISTDINAIDNGQLTIDKSLPLYNLQGQRVSHPVKGQIYIQNGRKIKF